MPQNNLTQSLTNSGYFFPTLYCARILTASPLCLVRDFLWQLKRAALLHYCGFTGFSTGY